MMGLTYYTAAEAASRMAGIPLTSAFTSSAMTDVVDISNEEFLAYFRTYGSVAYEDSLGTYHGYLLIGYFAMFVLFASVHNLLMHMLPHSESARKLYLRRPGVWQKRWLRIVSLPPLVASSPNLASMTKRGSPYPIVTRYNALIVAGYVLLGLVLPLTSYQGHLFADNTKYPGDKLALFFRYLANRCGMMAIMQLPVMFLFAFRNNELRSVTGWPYKTFNLFHKWIGRVMWLLILFHALAYSALYLQTGKYYSRLRQSFFLWGILATTIAGIILVQSLRFFRRRDYETFLIVHVVLTIVFIPPVYWHLELKHKSEWLRYLYWSIAIWLSEHIVRIFRILYLSFGAERVSTADVTVIESENGTDAILSLTVHTARKIVVRPGQYVFLHFKDVSPLQSHPFTILDQHPTTGALQFVAKVHFGITRDIFNHVRKTSATIPDSAHHKAASVRGFGVAIDGVHGQSAPIAVYDTVCLIAGGAGIASIYGYFTHLLRSKRIQAKHVVLIWIIRHHIQLEMIRAQLEEVIHTIPHQLEVDIRIFITTGTASKTPGKGTAKPVSPTSSSDTHKGSGCDFEKGLTSSSRSPLLVSEKATEELPALVQIQFRRPQIHHLLSEVVAEAPASVAVLACGPVRLLESVRKGVGNNLDVAKGRLDYFEEAFEW